jgi:hypothetical protein
MLNNQLLILSEVGIINFNPCLYTEIICHFHSSVSKEETMRRSQAVTLGSSTENNESLMTELKLKIHATF